MRVLFAVAFCLSSVSLFGGTWYVDASRSDDTGDGRSLATAKKHIQSAVDLAEASSDDMLTVLVAPGTYESGEYVDSNGAKNRVVIKKAMTLKATGSRDDTVIVGAMSASGAYGLGTDSIRCVCVDGQDDATAVDGTVIQGFTFRDGSAGTSDSKTAPAGAGGAVCFNKDAGSVYVKDCTALNCAAYYGGGFRGVAAIRTLVKKCHNNAATGRGAALYLCKAYNCIFVENGPTDSYKEYILQGAGPYVNCTAVANNGSLMRCSTGQVYNSLSILASRQEFDNTNYGGDYNVVSYSAGTGSGKQENSKVVDSDTKLLAVMVAPLSGDYRPRTGGLADGAGDPEKCKQDWVPYEDQDKDFAGNPRVVGEKVDVGAFQGTVSVAGGTLVSLDVVPTEPPKSYLRKWFAHAVAWPEQVRITPPEGTFCVKVNDSYPRFNDSNGGFWQTIPPAGTTAYLTNVVATATLEVGADKTYQTIQAAIDAAGAGAADYTVIKVAPGTYATGERELSLQLSDGDAVKGMSNRVAIVQKNVFLCATGSAADTVIRGAADASQENGLGDAAVRCVGIDLGAGSACFVGLRGFTLENGYTKANNSEKSAATLGGGWFVGPSAQTSVNAQLLESTVRACSGASAVIFGGWLQACAVRENDSERLTVRTANVSSCVLTENSISFDQIIGNSTHLYLSTLLGAGKSISSATSYLYGSILCDGTLNKSPRTQESLFWNLTISGGPTEGFITADPHLVCPSADNFAPWADSPVLGGADPENITDFWQFATGDLNGEPLNITETHRVTIGAVQNAYVPKTLYVDAAKADDSGDGLTRATAKKTLAGAAVLALSGDTIRAAAGTYESGTMTQTVAVIKASFSAVPSRAILKPGVALVSDEGAAVTKIRGVTSTQSTAPGPWIRGLVLGNGASVTGFTFENCGARASKQTWVSGNKLDDYLGGALLSSTNVGDSVMITDCVFTGALASFGGVGFGRATYRRCVFDANTNSGTGDSGAGIVYCGTFENCLFTGNSSRLIALGSYGDIRNCSFVGNNWIDSACILGYSEAGAQVCNTLIADVFRGTSTLASASHVFLPKISGKAWNWTITEGAETCITNVTLAAGNPGLSDAGAWTNSTYTVDQGDNTLIPSGTDLVGVPRILNGSVDIGCYERDVRGEMSARLSSRGDVTVAEVSPSTLLVDGGVRLVDGASMKVAWKDRGLDPSIGYKVTLVLAGEGEVSVLKGGQVIATWTTSGVQVLNLASEGMQELTFAYAGEGTATVSHFTRAIGFGLFFR